MDRSDCFARVGGMCVALFDVKCSKCSFYKTKEENLSGRAAAMARIATLSYAKQKDIAQHYYDDKWPWKEVSE
jgi:hypothetical protein